MNNVNEKIEDGKYILAGHDQNGNPLYKKAEEELLSEDEVQENERTLEVVKLKHDQSVKQYPGFGIEENEDEFVLKEITRSHIGLVGMWISTGFVFVVTVILAILMLLNDNSVISPMSESVIPLSAVALLLICVGIAAVVVTWIASSVYKENKIIITNKRIIQVIAKSVFNKKVQTIDGAGVEDVSYHKIGFLSSLMNFGQVKISTVGSESTYALNFVDNPEQVSIEINNLVNALKTNNTKEI